VVLGHVHQDDQTVVKSRWGLSLYGLIRFYDDSWHIDSSFWIVRSLRGKVGSATSVAGYVWGGSGSVKMSEAGL
jgi:hypothetical protein